MYVSSYLMAARDAKDMHYREHLMILAAKAMVNSYLKEN